MSTIEAIREIFISSPVVLRIKGFEHKKWMRDVPEGDRRRGPWNKLEFEVVDEKEWKKRGACLYIVADKDSLKYVGISSVRFRDRWRPSPAMDPETGERLPERHLFHSECMKHIEMESSINTEYEVRCIQAEDLAKKLELMRHPLSVYKESHSKLVAEVERWMCEQSSPGLFDWNIALTNKPKNPKLS